MILRHGRHLFRVPKEVRNTSYLFFFITLIEGILWYLLPIYFDAQLHDLMLIGIVMSSYSVASMLTSLPAGDISDHLGRKLTFILGLIGAMLGFVLLLFGSFPLLLMAMIFYGAFSTFYYTSSLSHVLDYSKEKDIGRNTGVFEMCNDAGWTLGPFLAGLALSFVNIHFIFLAAIFAFFIAIFAAHHFLRGSDELTSKKVRSAERLMIKDKVYVTELKNLFKIGNPLLYIFLMSFAFGIWDLVIWTLEPLYIADRGQSLLLGGLALGLITAPYLLFDYAAGMFSDRFGERTSVLLGIALIISGHAIFFLNTAKEALLFLFIGLAVSSVGVVFMQIPQRMMIREKFKRNLRAEAVGFSDTAYSLGGIIAPLIVGSIASIDNFSIPFYFTLVLFTAAALVFYFFVRKR